MKVRDFEAFGFWITNNNYLLKSSTVKDLAETYVAEKSMSECERQPVTNNKGNGNKFYCNLCENVYNTMLGVRNHIRNDH